MPILILFATVEGQTGKIARFVADKVRAQGQEPVLIDLSDRTVDVPLREVDAIILAAPVHERRPPKAFEVFIAASREELEARRTLLLSVSLSAAFPEGLEEAADYVLEMKMRTGFKPDAEALVAGAVRTSQLDYFARQVLQHVVLRDRPYEPGETEHEFTDWEALERTVTAFLEGGAGEASA